SHDGQRPPAESDLPAVRRLPDSGLCTERARRGAVRVKGGALYISNHDRVSFRSRAWTVVRAIYHSRGGLAERDTTSRALLGGLGRRTFREEVYGRAPG